MLSAIGDSLEVTGMPEQATIDRWDRDHAWHPFTQFHEYRDWPPLHVERGEGCWLWDTAGKRYLDTNASVWTNVHGHNHPELNAVVREQLERVAHSTYLGLSHPSGAELGNCLAERAPGALSRVMFSDNGSNAIEIAMKLSYQYWCIQGRPERKLVIGMEGGYHGDTIATMSAGDSGSFHEWFRPWFIPARHFPRPLCRELNNRVEEADMDSSLAGLRNILEAEGEQVACLVIEPWMQGAAGMQLQPKGFLRQVSALCKQHGVHLILDEVFVAFGRMGSVFVCEQEGVEPDFLCLAKGISGGYIPLAATLTSEAIHQAFVAPFHEGKTFFHGHTFTGNPMAAQVALKSLELLETRIHSGTLAATIQTFGEQLEATLSEHPHVAQIRQRGLAAAIDLQPAAGQPAWNPRERMGWKVCLAAREQGLLLRPLGNSLLIAPPIVISAREIEFLCEQTKRAIETAFK